MSINPPRLIQDRCGAVYFRLIVPLSWRHIVKKTAIRRSLRTKDAGTAREAALLLSARVGHDIDAKASAHDDYTHLDALTIPSLQTAINKLQYEGIDFSKLNLSADAFLAPIAKRIQQQAEAQKRAEEKVKTEAKGGRQRQVCR